MTQYEYKVVPAPAKAERNRALKGTAQRFAHTLANIMNDQARDGWEYLRADTLPCEERSGLTGKTTVYQNMLVFRRALPTVVEEDLGAAGDAAEDQPHDPATPEEILSSATASLKATDDAQPG